MSNGRHVCHMTSVHARHDIRVFHKECRSLALAGYSVTLLVADGKGDAEDHKVAIKDTGLVKGRFSRLLRSVPRIYWHARKLKADVYQFHDPELLPVGWLLSVTGNCVVYDAHEDLPNDVFNKPYIKPFLRRPLSSLTAWLERSVGRRLAACVCTTDYIKKRFDKAGVRTLLLRNYPKADIDVALRVPAEAKKFTLVYAGAISENRGMRTMLRAVETAEVRLLLLGRFGDPALLEELKKTTAWQNHVDYRGVVDKAAVEEAYKHSSAGFIAPHPDPNYIRALPVKLFEYMMFGLPVIGADFDLWKSIIKGNDCGISVDPLNVDAIADAIVHLRDNPLEAVAMGERGKVAVAEKYSWETEFNGLDDLYKQLLRSSNSVGSIS